MSKKLKRLVALYNRDRDKNKMVRRCRRDAHRTPRLLLRTKRERRHDTSSAGILAAAHLDADLRQQKVGGKITNDPLND